MVDVVVVVVDVEVLVVDVVDVVVVVGHGVSNDNSPFVDNQQHIMLQRAKHYKSEQHYILTKR